MLVDDYDPLKGKRLQILRENGTVIKKLEPELDETTLIGAYNNMVLTRAADDKSVKLQRQGRLGAYPPSLGQEASQLGPMMSLKEEDWLVWAFRELGALIWKGVPLWRIFLYWMGNEEGNNYPKGLRVTPTAVPVGTQIPHAVGIAYASMLKGEDTVVMVYFGEGASSQGDFHEGLNFAGVYNTPTVFVCQNNQYAISLKRTRQTAAPTIAQKAIAYGFKGIQVDGNDLLALYAAGKEAVDWARAGKGPTLIESYTYRRGDHTTSDDASRYRTTEEIEEWERKDPLLKFKTYLEKKGIWNDEKESEAWKTAREKVEEAVRKAEAYPRPDVEEIFRHTYTQMPACLKEQMDCMLQREGEK
jgi:pyruvate dehydrogenase E1 component alpha subunit